MKILQFCLLVCLLPLQAFASESINETCTPEMVQDPLKGYKTFVTQHIDENMTAQKCKEVMKEKINTNDSCKIVNTFILADEDEVKAICKGQGVYQKETRCTESKEKFSAVVCRFMNSHMNCVHTTENAAITG
ncbi:hypothetical protein ATANTOWER_027640 [Ataeniobius toweri]|uniref:Ribonuclease A-domain domain-containing protein n=1 Tax=Ataeniobius toweri TaxID=208326 RepID=A0ABU7B8T5_9TELE|nr:hypothetical protein [Ataeniobius toweri]